MRVVLDTSVVLGEGQSSFRYFSELIPRLRAQQELEVELLPSPYFELPAHWYSETPGYQPLQKKFQWIPRGPIRRLLAPAKNLIERYRQNKWIYETQGEALFHSFFYTLPMNSKVPVVTIAHDATPELFPNEVSRGEHMATHLRQKKMSLMNAQRIIAVSESTKRDICKVYGLSPHTIDVIYHAVASDFYWDPASTSSLPSPYLLQVGGREHHRNFDRLLECFKDGGFFRDYLLVCAGAAWSSEEWSKICRLDLKDRVVLFETPTNRVLRNLYQHSELLVYPSLYEGFGFPPLEAMACGALVATSKGAGSIEEVCAEAALYFNPRDPKDIANTIASGLNSNQKESFRAKGFANLKRFSWDTTAARTIACYRHTLDS